MTYREAVARLLALRGGEYRGMRPGLERIEGLLAALGNPEQRYELIQIGGTNGKGSVAAILAAILRAAGRRVGLYTSPHLVSFRERIRVDGEAIAEDALVDGVEALATLFARFDATVFEAATALALDHFAREEIDVAVLEVGLGGRLDATTVGRPSVTVLTPIALDHQEILGDTLGAIAAEKAAIIRSGFALSAAQAPEAGDVIVARAAAVGVPLEMEGRDLSVAVERRDRDGQTITCTGGEFRLARARLAMPGAFQAPNALLAVAAAHARGAPEAAQREGLARARWPGRFELIGRDPTLVLDGAHNPAGARALADALGETFPGARATIVIGLSREKDARGILAALAPIARRFVCTASANPRAADPAVVRAAVPAAVPAVIAPSAEAALALARAEDDTPIVCVAGSLFLVADVLRLLRGDKPCPVEKAADSMEFLF